MIWRFSSDLGYRRQYFPPEVFAHPAKANLCMLQKIIDLYTKPGDTLLDPMAGTGSLMIAALIQRNVILRELQPEYVDLMCASLPLIRRRAGLLCGNLDIAQADAKTLSVPAFDHIITSPPYGFETGTSDSWERRKQRLLSIDHDARWHRKFGNATADKFRYAGGRENTGNKSGRSYWADMQQIYSRLAELLPSGGLMILILKNHYRRGNLIDVVGQTITTVESLNLSLIDQHSRYIDNLSLWQRRRREQGKPIVEHEDILVFQRRGV